MKKELNKNMIKNQEIICLKYNGWIIAETTTLKDDKKAMKKFISSRKYLSNISDYLEYETKQVDKTYMSPKLLVACVDKHNPEDNVIVTVEEFKYLKGFFVMYLDSLYWTQLRLEKLIRLTGHTEIMNTIDIIEKVEANPAKYLTKYILDDEILRVKTIVEYYNLLNDYKKMYADVESTLPEFAKVSIL